MCGPVICPERSPGEPTTWTVTRARPTDDTSHLDLTAAASVPFTGLSKLDELTSPVTKATTPDYLFSARLPQLLAILRTFLQRFAKAIKFRILLVVQDLQVF